MARGRISLQTVITLLESICMDYLKAMGSTHGRMATLLVDSSNRERSMATGFGRNQAPIPTPTTTKANIQMT
jgi:hypothetical protein